jgi:hypothetical protein
MVGRCKRPPCFTYSLYDEWVERLEMEGMGQELYDKLAWD